MTKLVLRGEGLHRIKAEGIADDVERAGEWPVRVSRWRRRPDQLLQLARTDGGVGVLDEAARPRLGATLERLTRFLFHVRLDVDGGGRQVELVEGGIAPHVLAEGLVPGTTYLLRYQPLERRPEPDVEGEAAVDAAWERIERWFAEHHPLGNGALSPGASEEALRALEEVIGRPIPAPLRRSLARHDGQGEAVTAITEGHELLDAASIVGEWTMMKEISDERGALDDWWRPSWVSFTADGSGNGYCLDAVTGEVLFRDHVEGGEVETRRFEGWLTRWAEELEAGEQVVDADGDVDLTYYANRYS
ncbi:Cell wall assembly regulator SMI1 [Blastococcus aurantiacus]|uniref:Cell wall assembly regulator SMI1 n=1 Tax=Blastococcus aurantiacus TaxID=1550231 RepID=A0A1G7NSX7_9ACTN|nr:SMI1/KNR4 family protein [Blastococcus aurantiacus]SDF77061.1 Cell wall assembly regulator SMI1 [Blastococcus aurantiacus]